MALAANQSGSSMIPIIDTFMSLHGDAVHSITCDTEVVNSQIVLSLAVLNEIIIKKCILLMLMRHKNEEPTRIQMV